MSATSTTVTSHAAFALLPAEVVESIQQTYFLHLLVNDPEKVVATGKSVLSMMQHANFRLEGDQAEKAEQHAELLERVKDAAHKAFWKEAVQVLSSPVPSVQLPRLRILHLDVLEALKPLFPPNHIVLLTLAAPPPPTTSPLLSTVAVLTEILTALRQRCAPIRDAQIDSLIASVSLPPPMAPAAPHLQPDTSSSPPLSPLAEFIVDHVKAILSLADEMKTDLNNFVLGSMTEDQLIGALSSTVKSKERQTVLQLWDGQDAVRSSWRLWLAEGPRQPFLREGSHKWIDRLLKALEADKAVVCVPPSALSLIPDANVVEPPQAEEVNKLPPQLFYSTPALLYVQNYIQAVIISAALRLLSRPPHQALTQASNSSDLTRRVWALLLSEVDSDNPHYSDTKIINLADEVVRARQQLASSPTSLSSPTTDSDSGALSIGTASSGTSLSPDEETRLRASVDRTLRSTDPVFLLLRKRLLDALEMRLLATVNDDTSRSLTPSNNSIPARMQTGRDHPSNRAGKRVKLAFESNFGSGLNEITSVPAFNVQGFEDPILESAISTVYRKLAKCIVWTESVWGDLV